jgi:RecJ-like exonuclease
VVQGVDEIDKANEVLCPASKEAGKRTTCAACKLCGGTSTASPKSIAIPMH